MSILCFGSLNLDHVYSVPHFVRAGETLASTALNDFCGGKGLNQAIAAAKAGAKVFHAGKIGADGEGLRARLEEYGIDTSYVVTDASVPTGHAIIEVVPEGQNSIITFGGANTSITTEDADKVLAHFAEGDILLLQNEISSRDYIIKAARERGMKIAINPSPMTDELKNSPMLKYVDWFILNEIEGFDLTGEREANAILDEMLRRFPGCSVMLTLGKDGAVYYDGSVRATHGIYDVKVVDTTAAGDTFAGYFLACMTEGQSIERTLELASKASSIAVSRPGASDSIPLRAEVEKTDIKLM